MKTFIIKSMFRMKALNSQLFNTQRFNIQKIVLAFTLLVSISGWATHPLYQFATLDSNSTEQRAYVKATEQAKMFLREATPKLNAEDKSLAQRVYDALMTVQFKVSDNQATTQLCNTRGSMFVNQYFLDTIFICDSTRPFFQKKYSTVGLNKISQYFIHEGVHLNRIRDECVATEFEITTMKKTSTGVSTRRSIEFYNNICNFSPDL